MDKLREDALAIFRAAVAAANANGAVKRHAGRIEAALRSGIERVFLVAVGKAAAPMASAVEEIVGTKFTGGLVVTKHGHAETYAGLC